jgi:small GTP-binding protein
MDTYSLKYKIVIVGDSGTGKTSILNKFITNEYKEKERTIGTDYGSKILIYNETKIKLIIWDTAGQERFADIIKIFYKDANAVIITFDITNYHSFVNVKKWIEKIRNGSEKNPYIIIVGTKVDMENERAVENIDMCLFFNGNNYEYDYIEVSAKDDINIKNLFDIITENLMKKNSSDNKMIAYDYTYMNNIINIMNIKNYVYVPKFSYCSMM